MHGKFQDPSHEDMSDTSLLVKDICRVDSRKKSPFCMDSTFSTRGKTPRTHVMSAVESGLFSRMTCRSNHRKDTDMVIVNTSRLKNL